MSPKLSPSLRLDRAFCDKDEMLLLVDKFKNVLFTNERRVEGEIDRRCSISGRCIGLSGLRRT